MKKQLSEQEKIDWIRLSRSENVGPVTFRTLLALYQTPTKALPQLQELAAKGGSKKKITVCSERDAQKELAATEKLGGRIVASCEDDYPEILKTLPDAPPIIT
ncbi:MAG: DNA-protecting protein DprA, partial [Alphaproteobacteria bacterium]|nr:DNA-protecting protein DprA [Alphaproteobacteria bacterium]